MIKKRYLYLTEEMLKKNPNFCEYMAPSFDARQKMVIEEVPKLGKEAAEKAISEWGRPKSDITHLIFCTTAGINMPGADFHLTNLLNLNPSIKRLMMYQQGCSGGGMVLRLAKDLAENNKDSRVLVVCSEITAILFRGPSEEHPETLLGQVLFGDGAGAIIVGSDPILELENPLFEIISTSQTIVPNSDKSLFLPLSEGGLSIHLSKDIPQHIGNNIIKALEEAFKGFDGIISDWNSIFWVCHPGGRAILDVVEQKCDLKPEKLRSSRCILSEYGNLTSVCVLFILDEMRKFSVNNGLSTTGEGLEWGVLFGFGPGLTIETVVIRLSLIHI